MYNIYYLELIVHNWGWLGGAMVLGKLPVPGRLSNLADSRARAYCPCSGCGCGLFEHLYSNLYLFSRLSPSLWEMARYRLKYCLKGPLNPNQPTNQKCFTYNNACKQTVQTLIRCHILHNLIAHKRIDKFSTRCPTDD